MSTEPIFYPSAVRVRRKRRQSGPTATPAAMLTLVASTYDAEAVGGPTVWLTFDRPIDIDSLVGSAITVDDGSNLGLKFRATGTATLEGPATLRVILVEIDSTEDADVRLNASAATGIVAVGDGATWAGASNLELPYP